MQKKIRKKPIENIKKLWKNWLKMLKHLPQQSIEAEQKNIHEIWNTGVLHSDSIRSSIFITHKKASSSLQ